MQHKRRKHLFFKFSIPLNLFITYSLVRCSIVLILLSITTDLPRKRVNMTLDDDDDGRDTRGKAWEGVGACVIAYGKFQPSGISEM